MDIPSLTVCGKYNYPQDGNATLTAQMIFDNGPGFAGSLIQKCKLRIRKSYLRREYESRDECLKWIGGRTFVAQHYLCLRYEIVNGTDYR